MMMVPRLLLLALVCVSLAGCGTGQEKGVNKDLDRPVSADKKPK
jgi:hypothetical protein